MIEPATQPASDRAATSDGAPPLLEMRGITKRFAGVSVLTDVDLDTKRGEVHAIVGENGAGKSTLMKVLSGAYQPDAGTIRLDGAEVRFGHPSEAQRLGVSIVYQEFNLLADRSVAQNIFLGREPTRGPFVDHRAMEEATAKLLAALEVEHSISPRALVRSLSVAQQQTIEIAKALSFDSKILVMDEPTAALSPHEVRSLFSRIRLLQARGLAVLYISHRLKEIFDLAARVTVLKDGRKVGTVATNAVTTAELVKMMVGRDLADYYPPHALPADLGDVRLRVRDGANDRLHDLNLDVHRGEIVGLAGLEGSGRTELARALFGVAPFASGTVELNGRPVQLRTARQAIRAGIGFLTEDRKTEGLVLPRAIEENVTLARRAVGVAGRERGGDDDAYVAELSGTVELRARSLLQEVQYLSGGNQQKVVLAKWLATKAQILIFDEPTRGIDVGAKAGIHELMRELAREGAAILMISSDLPEVIGMSDRILVMRDGTLAGELPAGASEAAIMLLATGERDAVTAA